MHNQYLTTRTRAGVRLWGAIQQGSPLCPDTSERDDAIAVFRRWFPKADMPVWNGDIGEFMALDQIQ